MGDQSTFYSRIKRFSGIFVSLQSPIVTPKSHGLLQSSMVECIEVNLFVRNVRGSVIDTRTCVNFFNPCNGLKECAQLSRKKLTKG